MNSKVYVESSVISYLTSKVSRDIVIAGRQAVTHDWWDNHRHRFDLYISVLVEDEIAKGDVIAAKLRLEKVDSVSNYNFNSCNKKQEV